LIGVPALIISPTGGAINRQGKEKEREERARLARRPSLPGPLTREDKKTELRRVSLLYRVSRKRDTKRRKKKKKGAKDLSRVVPPTLRSASVRSKEGEKKGKPESPRAPLI